jgi:hypothetical protein
MAFAPALALVGSVVSGITGFIGSMQQASAAKQQANYQAAVARNNQIIADQNAARTAQAGAVQAQNKDLRTRQVLGQIDAAQGASGVGLESESSQDVRRSAQQLGRLDAQTTLDNALLTARGQQTQAMNFGAEAQLEKAKASQINPFMSGLTSVIGSATSFSDKWTRFKLSGVDVGGGL